MTSQRKLTVQILSISILAAAWLIVGPDLLIGLGLSEKIAELLTLPVAMMAFLWIISGNHGFMRCEYRAFRRLLGK